MFSFYFSLCGIVLRPGSDQSVANLDVSPIWENPLFLKIIEKSAVDPLGVATHDLELIAAHSPDQLGNIA
jgi:hypothetical protein